MSAKIELQPSYILHTRPYRDTSLLIDALSADYGKVSLVAKGARKAKNNQRYLLQPLNPLLLSWQGHHALKTLIGVESSQDKYELSGPHLYSVLYANELLSYLLAGDDPAIDIFQNYEYLLRSLSNQTTSIEPALREFEFSLLDSLGYGINFAQDAEDGQSIKPNTAYYFVQDQGFVRVECRPDIRGASFLGSDLLAIEQRNFIEVSTRQAAKQLARFALTPHLRGRPLKSRELFRPLVKGNSSLPE